MPGPDIFQIGVSGLNNSQLGLSTTSHNIANVNTEGYSRQRTQFGTRIPEYLGGQFFGSGSEVSEVSRIFSQTIIYELRANHSVYASHESYLSHAQRLDNVVADATTGLDSALQNFFAAVNGVSESPSSIPARQVLLSQSQLVTTRLQSLEATFEQQRIDVNSELDVAAKDITKIASTIATLNAQIKTLSSDSASSGPSDVLDERDRQLTALSKLVNITTLDQADGTISVFMGTGQALVLGTQNTTIEARSTPNDPRDIGLFMVPITGTSAIDITAQMTGGKIGGLLQFRDELLTSGTNVLGRVAIGLASTFNAQHQLGMDLNGSLGGLFFTDPNSAALMSQRVIDHQDNIGTTDISIQIGNVNLLTDSNYELKFDGVNYNVTRLSDNTILSATTLAAAQAAVQAEGFSFSVTPGIVPLAAGDSFRFYPTRNMAGEISRVLDDVRELAAAAPVVVANSTNNSGTGAIRFDSIDASYLPVNGGSPIIAPANVMLTYDSTTNTLSGFPPTQDVTVTTNGVSVVNSAPVASIPYVAGSQISFGGVNVTLSGAPANNDSFVISQNVSGVGDNRNMQFLRGLQSLPQMDQGRSTYSQAYGRLVADVGTRTHEAEVSVQSSQTLLRQVEARRESVSGVNLDEEAANLLRFQQAYEASAQVISIARSLFDTLFQSVR